MRILGHCPPDNLEHTFWGDMMIIVLFGTELREDADLEDYRMTAKRMHELVRQVPGFISAKRFVAEDGEPVVIVRFESEEALQAWRNHPEHMEAQKKGRKSFYNCGWVQVCKTIRNYTFQRIV